MVLERNTFKNIKKVFDCGVLTNIKAILVLRWTFDYETTPYGEKIFDVMRKIDDSYILNKSRTQLFISQLAVARDFEWRMNFQRT